MKKTLLTITLLASAAVTFGQTKQGFNLSLREDLVDFSTMSVEGDTHNPYGTAYRHTFGSELSASYYLGIGDRWEFGIAAGLMMHDYSLTGIFPSWDEPTNTTADGLYTHTERQTYDKQTTLNLPVVASVKYLFSDWADRQLWDIVPLVSARLGYVVGLTGIDGDYYDELTVNPVANPYGLTPGTDRMWQTTRFDRQGFFWALGVGARFGHFDLELEYTCQPKHYVTDTRQESVDGTGTLLSATSNHSDYRHDNSDGLTLRLTYRF